MRRGIKIYIHNTGEIRGLLCQRCNFGLGSLKVDTNRVELLEKAIVYLKGDRSACTS